MLTDNLLIAVIGDDDINGGIRRFDMTPDGLDR